MPEFLPSDLEIWFNILERELKENRIINDNGKFTYAVTVINPKCYPEICDIILIMPEGSAYETLKSELIKRISSSQEKKTRHLLEYEKIGDRKPSQFLRHLRNLAGNTVNDDFLRTIWINQLPRYLQLHISGTNSWFVRLTSFHGRRNSGHNK